MVVLDKVMDKVMRKHGFIKVEYPVGHPKDRTFVEWYVKYGSIISKPIIRNIFIELVERMKKK